MNSKKIKYVLTLAKCGSFSSAANILNISQPSLSQYIKKIEDELETPLFERVSGNLKLTDAGKAYIEIGRKILDLEANFQDCIKDLKENKTGTVTIGTAPFRSATLMPHTVKKFKEIYSGIQVIIREMTTKELLEGLEYGEFDFCVTTLPVNSKIFNYDVIMEEEMILAVKKGSDTEKKLLENCVYENGTHDKIVDLNLLNNEEFVMLTDNQIMQKSLCYLCEKYNLKFKKTVEVKSLEAQIEMVAAGVGCAIVPTGITKLEGLNNKVSYFSFSQEHPKRILAAVYQKDKYLTKPMIDFIKILKNK